jgi:AraC-like DNA-binding protein
MQDRPLLLHRFPLVDTSDPDAFRDLSINVFGVRGFELCGPERCPPDSRQAGSSQPGSSRSRNGFRAAMNWVWFRHIDLGLMKFNATFGYQVDPNVVRQQFRLSGSARTTIGGRPYVIDRDSTCVIPTGVDIRHDYAPAYSELRLRIQESALRSKLGAMTGAPAAGTLTFASPSRVRSPELTRLRRLIDHLVAELDREEGPLPEMAVDQYEQSLMVCFLFANRNNFSHLLERKQPCLAGSQVRRAEEYIEANASLPIAIEALAAVTEASALSLSAAFREARGMSPLAFLKSIRLKHARRILQTADGATTVATVARRFGFANPGRFAGAYRQAFGELPSATLTNSRAPSRRRKP